MRAPHSGDYAQWAELRAESRQHLQPWEPTWPSDDLTRLAFRRRLRHYAREARDDLGYALVVLQSNSDRLMGGVTLSNIRRGVTQSATLGYWLGRSFVGRGVMTEAIECLLPFAFDGLRLHRLEAAIQPTNVPSMRVLEKCGFVREGYARRYLKINGEWQDHVLYGLLAEDRPQVRRASP
jgi:ribosomal-protein-alanine N-acetyltransferase